MLVFILLYPFYSLDSGFGKIIFFVFRFSHVILNHQSTPTLNKNKTRNKQPPIVELTSNDSFGYNSTK
ncbi:hypothetical protein ERO13_A07G106933v2 [Gossypium hirsutum]|uniref:Uncharacterized protein n=2 Tax=Gossypium TaxID=3633 RepID=A0A5D2YJ14_GOSMU|nr:hypothetical protein ERO13_A07G106933v2 [Gossypium hirsutum]TYH09784.1 hypothetical protein ES288_A07G124600v1 [Gossypium darwinii]TYJ26418.1 hypothetical protein E1A91_A07G118200v1 [Gossypium mustelinum]